MFSDRNNIGSGDFGDCDTTIRLVGCVEIDMIGSDTSSDGELEILGFGEAFRSQIAGMEAVSRCQSMGQDWNKEGNITYGVVMIISASTSSLSNVEFSPSLSEVVTKVCP